jgi:hypothetical protein
MPLKGSEFLDVLNERLLEKAAVSIMLLREFELLPWEPRAKNVNGRNGPFEL